MTYIITAIISAIIGGTVGAAVVCCCVAAGRTDECERCEHRKENEI